MASYFQVSPLFWSDPQVRAWDDSTKLLALYLLTCPHRSLEGMFRLPLQYAEIDLKWPERKLSKHFSALQAEGFVQYDPDAQVVLLAKSLKYHSPRGPKQIKGALNALRAVPPTPLFAGLIVAAREYAPDFAEALSEGYSQYVDTLSEGYPLKPNQTKPNTDPFKKSKKDFSDERPEIDRLCFLLAELISARDGKAKVSPQSERWRSACRLLIDRDGRSVDEVERMIRWCQADGFWSGNVLSMPALRKHFTAMVAQQRRRKGPVVDSSARSSKTERQLEWAAENVPDLNAGFVVSVCDRLAAMKREVTVESVRELYARLYPELTTEAAA